MELKRLRSTQDSLKWPVDNTDLPVISWKDCQSLFSAGWVSNKSNCSSTSNWKSSAHSYLWIYPWRFDIPWPTSRGQKAAGAIHRTRCNCGIFWWSIWTLQCSSQCSSDFLPCRSCINGWFFSCWLWSALVYFTEGLHTSWICTRCRLPNASR